MNIQYHIPWRCLSATLILAAYQPMKSSDLPPEALGCLSRKARSAKHIAEDNIKAVQVDAEGTHDSRDLAQLPKLWIDQAILDLVL